MERISAPLLVKSTTSPPASIWLSRKELSQRWGVPVSTLASQACEGRGPRYIRLGRHVRYSLADIEAFEQANLRTPGEASSADSGIGGGSSHDDLYALVAGLKPDAIEALSALIAAAK